MSVVFTAQPLDASKLGAGDDALNAAIFSLDELPSPLVFDHEIILADYARSFGRLNGEGGKRP